MMRDSDETGTRRLIQTRSVESQLPEKVLVSYPSRLPFTPSVDFHLRRGWLSPADDTFGRWRYSVLLLVTVGLWKSQQIDWNGPVK